MASKTLFKSRPGPQLLNAEATNNAGGIAYAMPPKHALAQYASTGCLGHTYYASAEEQLSTVLKLCNEVDPTFVAKTAIYARTRGYMKDLPALLLAALAAKPMAGGLVVEAFDKVVDDARMLRNFVQIVRSGVTGRKSLGTMPKRLVQNWFDRRTDDQVFRASVGNDPSLADVIKLVHPRPATASRKALYGYLIGREHDASALPMLVRQFEAFKRDVSAKAATSKDAAVSTKAVTETDVPNVPFQMLTALPLTPAHWKAIAWGAPWQMTRMNLNTFARHGVFTGPGGEPLTAAIAARLRDPEQIGKAKVFPYQLMVAFSQCDPGVPAVVRDALQDAMEVAIANVPAVPSGVWVLPDVSGSMHSPVTGHRPGATSVVRCVDVAALVAAAMLRRNPTTADVLPFETTALTHLRLNPRDSVMTNAKVLSSLPGGGTNCSAPLAELNRRKAKGDLVVYVSDNESWVDSRRFASGGGTGYGPTATMGEWAAYKARNPSAKLVCIDLTPNKTTQAVERPDVLNVGGFSDRVFDVIAEFAAGTLRADHWVGVIEGVAL